MPEIKEYQLSVHFESDHVWAQVVELPGCFASGRDMHELREALEEALTLYLADDDHHPKVAVLEFAAGPGAGEASVPIRAELMPA